MSKEKKLKKAYQLWVESRSNNPEAYEAEIDLIDMCADNEYINEYINLLDSSTLV